MKARKSPPVLRDLDVLGHVRATILVTDRAGTIVQAHGGGGLPLGYAPEQLEGHNGLEFIAPEDHQVMAELFIASGDLPLVANPEPFPLQIIGPDGVCRIWDCLPGGFTTDDAEGWIATLTCRKEQSPSTAAMDSFVAGGSPLDIAAAVAARYQESNYGGWHKSALVIFRSALADGSLSPWRTLEPAPGTDPRLLPALEACLGDPGASWNRIGPGVTKSDCPLPEPLQTAANAAGRPYCSMLACGINDQTRLVFIRVSDFGHEIQGNTRLADQAINDVVVQALRVQQSRNHLNHAIRLDPLTGIPNRFRFEEVVNDTPPAGNHAALFIDIDDFKTVNDTFGHAVGDAALREVAARIVASCRAQDFVARIGGDEFGVILRNASEHDTRRIADTIRSSMSAPFGLETGPGVISVTVGSASPDDNTTLEELVRRADHAMLANKTTRRHPV